MTLPYASASSGAAACNEIVKILQRFGCTSVGFMDEFETHTLILAFAWRRRRSCGRRRRAGQTPIRRANPWSSRRHCSEPIGQEFFNSLSQLETSD